MFIGFIFLIKCFFQLHNLLILLSMQPTTFSERANEINVNLREIGGDCDVSYTFNSKELTEYEDIYFSANELEG